MYQIANIFSYSKICKMMCVRERKLERGEKEREEGGWEGEGGLDKSYSDVRLFCMRINRLCEMTASLEKWKNIKDVCAVTEAAFSPPDTLGTPEVCKALCSPANGPENKCLILYQVHKQSLCWLCLAYQFLKKFLLSCRLSLVQRGKTFQCVLLEKV